RSAKRDARAAERLDGRLPRLGRRPVPRWPRLRRVRRRIGRGLVGRRLQRRGRLLRRRRLERELVMAVHPRWVRDFLSASDLDAVAAAVTAAEARTAAEIRVHLDHRCPGDPMARAVEIFERLGMHRTELRAGVLVYVAVADRKLAVIGDAGIHTRVGQAYWD